MRGTLDLGAAAIATELARHVGEDEATAFIADHGVARAAVWLRALGAQGREVNNHAP